MKKQVKVEWCENFIKAKFKKYVTRWCLGIETNHMFQIAENAGLYERGTYGTPFSEALGNICTVETVTDENGNFLYSYFKMKDA